jgi:peroxiredoxin-like protein
MTGLEPRKYIYNTQVKWIGGDSGKIASDNKPSIQIALPEELGGPKGIWSPDELFVSSVEACAMLTFFWLINEKNIEIISYESTAEGISQIAADGEFRFTTIALKPKIVISNKEDFPKVEDAIGDLDNWCCVSNSTKAKVEIKAEIIVQEEK